LFAATLAGALALAVSPASSQTLRYANQGELKSLDPYTLNESRSRL
jgi:peptide/nickel transport system substrate-binding protein